MLCEVILERWPNKELYISSWTLNIILLSFVGVIETGLFINMASKAYFGMPDGSVTSRKN